MRACGSGKSRTGSEFMRDRVEHGAETLALAGPTYNHVLHFMLGGRRGKKGNGSGRTSPPAAALLGSASC